MDNTLTNKRPYVNQDSQGQARLTDFDDDDREQVS